MKAIVWTKYGGPDALELREVDKPVPKPNDLLIRVYASTVTAGDSEMRSMRLPLWMQIPLRLIIGITRPRGRILGQELAGVVEAVGAEVTNFAPGDEVFTTPGVNMGGYGEYALAHADRMVAKKPRSYSFAEAATLGVGAFEALKFMRTVDSQPGCHVLLNGAGGSIGTYAIQMLKHRGVEVTAVDAAAKLEMLRELGADHVIDYVEEDFTKSGKTYDVIFDIAAKCRFGAAISALNPAGQFVMGDLSPVRMLRGILTGMRTGKKVHSWRPDEDPAHFVTLTEWADAGVIKPVIDRTYPLEKTADAHAYVDSGAKKGNVVVQVVPESA